MPKKVNAQQYILFRRGHGEPGFPVRKLINALNYLKK